MTEGDRTIPTEYIGINLVVYWRKTDKTAVKVRLALDDYDGYRRHRAVGQRDVHRLPSQLLESLGRSTMKPKLGRSVVS